MSNINELSANLKAMKMNLTNEVNNLSIEELELVYRYFTLQTRVNTLEKIKDRTNNNDPMQMMMEIFMNAKKEKKDPVTDMHNQTITDIWVAEIKKEMDELRPKLYAIYGKIYIEANYQYLIDGLKIINDYMAMSSDKEDEQ